MYAFFDGVDVTGYMLPKVIEITKSSSADPNTNETPFVVGETVIGQTSKCQLKVAAANDGLKTDPYGVGQATLAESYASPVSYTHLTLPTIYSV